MFDIITFGSATWDIFLTLHPKFWVKGLRPKNFQIARDKKFITGKGICFNSGSKVDVEDIYFSSGGGGTNTIAGFLKQGLRVAYCGRVGDDIGGQEIIEELKDLGINPQFIFKTKLKPTNHSVILTGPRIDRTILVYRGASELLGKKDVPWNKLRAKWFYLAPLSGELCNITEKIVNFAYKNKIKIAINPGNSQLSLPLKALKRILKKVDILILNQEEASLLTKIPYQKEKKIFKEIDELCPGIVIMTKGPLGAVVSNGKYLYRSGVPKSKVVDRTGAGDSFASGFVSGFIRKKGNIEYAIQLATANATSCLKKWGAKQGLLKKDEKFKKVKIEKTCV